MNVKEIVESTIIKILEESAYMLSDSIDEFPILGDNFMSAEINFSNDKVGIIQLSAEKGLFVKMASNMLGCEETDDKAFDMKDDSLCEFLNILAGNIITELFGDDVVIDLSLPNFINSESINIDDYSVWLNVEGFNMVVNMKVDSE